MTDFVDYLREVFELLGPVTARRMFGGFGIYCEDPDTARDWGRLALEAAKRSQRR